MDWWLRWRRGGREVKETGNFENLMKSVLMDMI